MKILEDLIAMIETMSRVFYTASSEWIFGQPG